MKKRIFIGSIDICHQIIEFKEAFEKLGYKTFTFIEFNVNTNGEANYSFNLSKLYPRTILGSDISFFILLRKFFTMLIVEPIFYMFFFVTIPFFDYYILMWPTSRKWKFILWLLNLFHKKIYVMFVGNDIRWRPLAIQEFEYRKIEYSPQFMDTFKKGQNSLNDMLRTIRICEKYATVVSSTPDQSQLSLRPYIVIGLPLNLQKIRPIINDNSKPKVALGITEPTFKGSYLIKEIILSYMNHSQADFEFVVIENKSHEESIALLQSSDIFIYSPFGLTAGKFGFEALAAGCVVLTGHDPDYVIFPPNSPIVHITSENMINKLEFYLVNQSERKELSEKGRKWVEKYCSDKFIYNKIMDYLNNNKLEHDIYPTFFREKATFSSSWDDKNAIDNCNYWTKYVKDCDWYNKYVESGERDGLIF